MVPKESRMDECITECAVKNNLNINDDVNDPNSKMKIEKRDFISTKLGLKTDIEWHILIYFTALNLVSLYSLLTFPYIAHFKSTLFILFMFVVGVFGNTGGCHRYWSHRSYKANVPLRIILLLSHCSSGIYSMLTWVKDHRVHHKYTDTDADPHSSSRGFFYSHCGWIFMKIHPECRRRLKEVDVSDFMADPIAVFGEKHFQILRLFCCYIIPVVIPVYVWNESWYYAIVSQYLIRHPLVVHSICSINSVAHFWGSKPYNKGIRPAESLFVGIFAAGEGWHNYHHSFPWDYKAAEFGNYSVNITTFLIDIFAKIGWAYDLKEASSNLIKAVITNKGDGSHTSNHSEKSIKSN